MPRRWRRRHELLHIEGGSRIHHRAARRHREHGKRVGLAAREIGRAFDGIDGDVGLEGGARAPEPLATLRLRRLALGRGTDHHRRIDIDIGKRRAHRIERSAPAIHAVATSDPIEGRERGTLGDTAKCVDEFRVHGTRTLHESNSRPFVWELHYSIFWMKSVKRSALSVSLPVPMHGNGQFAAARKGIPASLTHPGPPAFSGGKPGDRSSREARRRED